MKRKLIIGFVIFFILVCRRTAFSQMLDADAWKNYEPVLEVKNNLRSYDYKVEVIQSNNRTNVLWPGEQPKYIIQITNKRNTEIKVVGKVDMMSIGARGGDDIWLPELVRIKSFPSIDLDVTVPASGFVNLNLNPDIPSTFGAYALVLDLGKYGRSLITSVVRTFAASPEKIQFPKQSLDDIGADNLQRLGIQAIRLGVDYVPTHFVEYRQRMEALDKELKEYQNKHITVLLMFDAGPDLTPLGTARSFLDSAGVMLNTKQDFAWLPSMDEDFKKFVRELCLKYGWPKGPVTAVSLWNEPWEGISISGWQADMLRYREIYQKMADGVLDARKQGVNVLIGGGDSGSNAWDKLFPDGSMSFLPIFDFCSIHYQGMEAPSIYPEWVNRKGENGRVKIWDTESWVANSDDRIGLVIAANRSAGYDRNMGIYGGYLFSGTEGHDKVKINTTDGPTEIEATPKAWPQAAALGAAQHLIGERNFKELLFKKGLPWIMVFEGPGENPDDGTVVVCGDMGAAFGKNSLLFNQIKGLDEINQKETIRKKLQELPDSSNNLRDSLQQELKKDYPLRGASLSFPEEPGFYLYDFYGNMSPASGGRIIFPLASTAYYIKTNGKKGSFEKLISALRQAKITGYEPVEIIAKDLTQRIDKNPTMVLTMTNILNRPVKGQLSAKLGDLDIEYPAEVSFRPFETKNVSIRIKSSKSSPANVYPLAVHYVTSQDGMSVHYEDMHVDLISHLSVNIDGNLDDWKDALAQTVTSNDEATVSVTEAAWYPFKNFSKKATGVANGYLAYDKDYFYFACKTADSSPHPGTYRFSERPDDDFFYPDTAWKYNASETLWEREDSVTDADSHLSALMRPTGKGKILHYWQSIPTTNSFGLYLQLPENHVTQVSFYLPNLDVWKADIEIFDSKTGSLLAKGHSDKLWQGAYEIFNLSGNVKVVFHSSQWWYTVKLGALFFDSLSIKAQGSSAIFIKEDLDTKGEWKNKYGIDGYYIAGLQAGTPKSISVDFAHIVDKEPLVWPKDTRHFTYRKDPVLPDNSGLGFSFDNVQIAFNAIPIEQDELLPNPPGTMPKYIGYKCTDYEYSLNSVDPKYGGGTEIWRLLVPGMNRKHFYPRQPKSPGEGAVTSGKLVIKREGNTLITEAAIPWSEIPEVKKALDSGKKIKFSFRVNDNGVPNACMELAKSRSVSKQNARAFHPDWQVHWANEVEFGFEK